MKISQKNVELFLNELKSYRRLSVSEMNYYIQNHEELILELRRIREKLRREREEKEAAKNAEKAERERRLKEELERQRAEEEERRAKEESRISEITSMDLPTDFENLYMLDSSLSDIHTESVTDALILSLSNLGHVDIEYIAALTGQDYKSVITALKGAIYQNPDTWEECFYKGWEDADSYLSGPVLAKWKSAKEANEIYNGYFADNVAALEKILPRAVPSSEIYVTLGSPWIPSEIIDDFLLFLIGDVSNLFHNDALKVRHDEETGTWEIPIKSRYRYTRFNNICEDTYGTYDMNALQIIEKTLNQANVAVYDELTSKNPSLHSKTVRVLNQPKTLRLIERQKEIVRIFKEWIWTDPKRKRELEEIYESRFCSNRVRHFDGSFLTFPGLSEDISLYPYQKNAVARILFTPNTLLAHDVGSGKTYIMIAAGMELKRMKISEKNVYVVPNNLVGQWRDIFLSMYKDASVLTVEPKSFTPSKRFDTLRRIRDEEFDGIIMAYSCFERIPFSKKFEIEKLESELEYYNQSTSKLYSDRFAQQKKSLERRLKEINARPEEALGRIFFDELGINTVFLDEAHNYKNVPLHTHIERVLGISSSGSVKCQDMIDKINFVQRSNGGRGAVLATGTPITNSITDAFVMQKFLQNGDLKLLGLSSFDGWVGMFAEKHTDFEVDIDTSTFRLTTRFSRFHNLPELTSLLASVADFHMVDKSAGIPDFNGYIDSLTTTSPDFEEYLKLISSRADDVRAGRIPRHEDNLLLITTDGRKAALDMRLIDPSLGQRNGSKAQLCADNVYAIYKMYEGSRATQLIFCDYSTPKASFNLYDELKALLISYGMPKEEIAFVHSATSPKKREALFEAVRRGDIRVLIGSTFKLGLGVNVQDKLVAIHHLDVPWRPADMTQREGRILRQGNTNKEVFVLRYVTKGSFDAYSWQLLETKQRFIASILSGHLSERDGSDVCDTVLSYAEVKALAVGNPLIKARIETANELDKCIILQRESVKRNEAMAQELETLPVKIENQRKILDAALLDMEQSRSEVYELSRDERRSLREAIEYGIRSNVLLTKESPLLTYRGFELTLPAGMSAEKPFIWLCRNGKYYLELGEASTGYLVRIDNFLDNFEKQIEKLRGGYDELVVRKNHIEGVLAAPESYSEKIAELREKLNKIDKDLGV